MKWPENSDPLWHIDLLIANEIVAPVLQKYAHSILLWRFHRRAARDAEGHQFSLTFYASAETANQLFHSLRTNEVLKKMKRARILLKDLYDDTGKNTAPRVEDTSDGHWAPAIRQSWPFYIMGVCQMWLSLVRDISEAFQKKRKTSSVRNMILGYKKVNESINTLWRDQGNHAFLHHLNAIFGYEPLLVREVHLKKF